MTKPSQEVKEGTTDEVILDHRVQDATHQKQGNNDRHSWGRPQQGQRLRAVKNQGLTEQCEELG